MAKTAGFRSACGTRTKRLLAQSGLRRRQKPRRIVHGLTMNHEFDMFETRLAIIGDVVDVFALHEANITNDGRPKQPLFYNKFHQVSYEK